MPRRRRGADAAHEAQSGPLAERCRGSVPKSDTVPWAGASTPTSRRATWTSPTRSARQGHELAAAGCSSPPSTHVSRVAAGRRDRRVAGSRRRVRALVGRTGRGSHVVRLSSACWRGPRHRVALRHGSAASSRAGPTGLRAQRPHLAAGVHATVDDIVRSGRLTRERLIGRRRPSTRPPSTARSMPSGSPTCGARRSTAVRASSRRAFIARALAASRSSSCWTNPWRASTPDSSAPSRARCPAS